MSASINVTAADLADNTRREEIRQLAQQTEHAQAVADAVAPFLAHKSDSESPSGAYSPRQCIRLCAASMLATCGSKAADKYIPDLVAMIPRDHEEDSGALREALCCLRVRERAPDEIVALLSHERGKLRQLAAWLLVHPVPELASAASSAAAVQWESHVAAVADLVVSDEDGQVRQGAARYLADVGAAIRPHVQKLVEAFHDESSSVRRAAAETIGSLREHVSTEHVESIIAGLADPDNAMVGGGAMSVRRAALLAFTGLCKPTDEKLLAGRSAVQDTGAPSPAELSPAEPSPAVLAASPRLVALLSHEDVDAREMAVRAMIGMGGAADVQGLIGRLCDDEEDVRRAAVDALLQLRQHVTTRDQLAAITALLTSDEEQERRAAADVLGAVAVIEARGLRDNSATTTTTSDATETMPREAAASALLELVGADDCAAVRAAAAAALGSICAPLSAMAANMEDGTACADELHATRHPTLAAAIAAVGAMLEDGDSSCRAAAVAALATLGAVHNFEDEVGALMGDRSAAVRNAAQAALR